MTLAKNVASSMETNTYIRLFRPPVLLLQGNVLDERPHPLVQRNSLLVPTLLLPF